MRKALLLATALGAIALAAPASAATILTFGQLGGGDPITATINSPADTSTNLDASNVAVSITQIFGGGTTSGFLTLHATSVGAATNIGGGLVDQSFTGMFSITSLSGGLGNNILSGTFTDAVFGAGTGLTLTASDATAGESVTFTSTVLPAIDLLPPQSVNLDFADVTPPATITGTTLGAFTASVAGNFSATPVPEPFTLGILGVGIAGLGYVRRQRKAA
jgi:PEP-CTERM motif